VISSGRSCGCCSPASFTRTSSRPKARTVSLTTRRHSFSSPTSGLLRIVLFLEVDDRNPGALFRGSDCNGAPDPAISARDQNGSILQFVAPAVLGAVAARLRLHLGLNARLMILVLCRKRRCLFGCRHNTDLIAASRRIKLSLRREQFYARIS
jgi:hypothetical protein